MKRILIIMIFSLVLIALFVDMASTNTGMHFMRVGRLFVNAEYDGAEGWSGQFAWPGGYIQYPDAGYGIRELFGANVRKCGTLAGCTNWTGPDGTVFPYWTSGMYRTYDYDYLPFWKNQTNQTALMPVTQVLIQRWPQPNIFVDGVNITPDGGDDFLGTHDENTEIDPDLVAERAIKSVWRYTMGVEYVRMMYGYSSPKHYDYSLWDITLTNNGKVFGLPGDTPSQPDPDNPDWPYILENQTITDFWWAQTMNPWNGRAGRDRSISPGNDEWGEFVLHNGRRFALFYDGDNPDVPEMDFADPSTDERWVELLSPAYLCVGALYADNPDNIGTDDPTQPRSTIYRQERDYDLGKIPKTMEDQYNFQFEEGRHYDLDTPHIQINPEIKIPSPYTAFGPYNLAFNQSINIVYVIAAGGLSHKECVDYGRRAWDAGYTGPVMDEIRDAFLASRDSVFVALQNAADNVNNVHGQGRFNVPDAPRPPANFWVAAEGATVKLSWSNESAEEPDFDTGVDDFEGYRVYRAVGARDSVYRVIYDGTATETVDTDVTPGFQYFYYVVAYDDGSQNWEDPGQSLESSKYHTWTGWAPTGASPSIDGETNLEKIRVVPNPYSAAGKTYPGEPDKIVFTGLPPKCTITVYTTNGDYVHKIEHTDGSNSEDWDLRTEFNQYIVSDVYIYTVESDLGDHVDKFIIVR
jgi:hypothetical protein